MKNENRVHIFQMRNIICILRIGKNVERVESLLKILEVASYLSLYFFHSSFVQFSIYFKANFAFTIHHAIYTLTRSLSLFLWRDKKNTKSQMYTHCAIAYVAPFLFRFPTRTFFSHLTICKRSTKKNIRMNLARKDKTKKRKKAKTSLSVCCA